MKEALKVFGAILVVVSLIMVVAISVGYHRSHQGGSEGDALRTDREYYTRGESVVFILRNVWNHQITYDSEFRETLSIYDRSGRVVVMLPPYLTLALTRLEPNETMEWEWDQTYYLYETDFYAHPYIEWDQRTGTRVPPGTYTTRVEFGDISAAVGFRILP